MTSSIPVHHDNAFTAADDILRKKGRSFHWARRLLKGDHAARATRLYSLCRHLDDLADEAVEMTAFEEFVTEEVLKGRSIVGLYPPTLQQSKDDFVVWRKVKNR